MLGSFLAAILVDSAVFGAVPFKGIDGCLEVVVSALCVLDLAGEVFFSEEAAE